MTTRLTVDQVRENLADVLSRVRQGDRAEIVDADGTAVAVIVNAQDFDRYEQAAGRDFFDIVAEIHERNRNVDPDQVMRDVTAVVEDLRRSRHERGH